MRGITRWISEGFIWGVGITRPKRGQERRAAIYITSTLIGVVLLALVAFLAFVGRL